MIECIAVLARGSSHKAKNKDCQDSVYLGIDKKKTYAIIAVADGHGGEKYFRSKKGSELAVEVAKDEFLNFFKNKRAFFKSDERQRLETVKNLKARIVLEWREKVMADFKTKPLEEKEIAICKDMKINTDLNPEDNSKDEEAILSFYGTTLLAALYFPSKPFWCIIQIGDGLAFALDENLDDFCPVPEDESLGFGYTTSLCSKNAANDNNFRHKYDFTKLNALTLCSDGVADSFEKDKFGAFIKKIHANIKEYGSQVVQKELKEFFPKLSEQGSGDDVSLSGVFEVPDLVESSEIKLDSDLFRDGKFETVKVKNEESSKDEKPAEEK